MPDQCVYMRAAYPDLTREDTCAQHRHTPVVFALARAFAEVFFDAHASDEQVALFLDDADAVVDDFDPPPSAWDVRQVQTDELGVAIGLTINDREYVLPETEQEPEVPVALSTWREWHREND